MKQQLLLTALMAVTAFSAQASNNDKKIEFFQKYALSTAAVSTAFATGYFLKSRFAKSSLNRLIDIARAKDMNRSLFWGSKEVDDLVTAIRNGKKNAKTGATVTAAAVTAFAVLPLLKTDV